jgi:hypothetical protein
LRQGSTAGDTFYERSRGGEGYDPMDHLVSV